jgi:DUF1009 family protein
MAPKLGILAGGGQLPKLLIDLCRAQKRDVFVVAFQGHADALMLGDVPHAWVRLGEAGSAFRHLHDAGVQELVMAGPVRRPSLRELRPDWRATRFFAKVGMAALGDDGLLRAVIREIEEEGFRVVGVDDLLAGALAPQGPLGHCLPDAQAETDIQHGLLVARGLGALDVGQAVIVQGGIVLGVEAVEGTDNLLSRCATLAREGPGGVLIKTAKPQQDRRADLPTIGSATVLGASKAGLRGIAIEAGSVIVIDRDQVAETADRHGLFVLGVT